MILSLRMRACARGPLTLLDWTTLDSTDRLGSDGCFRLGKVEVSVPMRVN